VRVLAVFDDLLLGSNVLGMLGAAGHDAQLAGAASADPAGADVVIVDLAGEADVEGLAERSTGKLVGVYSHEHPEQRARAEAAGFDLVVPRSRLAREGAALLERFSPG
jgi:predicted oxidoreductase